MTFLTFQKAWATETLPSQSSSRGGQANCKILDCLVASKDDLKAL